MCELQLQECLKECFLLIIIHYLLGHAVNWVIVEKGAKLIKLEID